MVRPGSVQDAERRPELIDWLLARQVAWRALFRPMVERLPAALWDATRVADTPDHDPV